MVLRFGGAAVRWFGSGFGVRGSNRRTAEPPHRRTARAALLCVAALALACGKKGPPLPPLNLVPDRPADTVGHVAGDTVYLSLTVPTKNANGRGPLALDHLEVYAITVDVGATAPPNRDLLTNAHAIATVPIKPSVDPDEVPDETAPADTRPGAGDKIVFAERLTEAQTTPQVKATGPAKTAAPSESAAPTQATAAGDVGAASIPTVPPLTSPESVPATGAGGGVVGVPPALPSTPAVEPPETAAEGTSPATPSPAQTAAPTATTPAPPAAQAPPPKPAPTVTRVYVVRGMTKKGRPGTPSARVIVPIVPPPPPPSAVTADFNESSVTIKWTAPEAGTQPSVPLAYNVYAAPASAAATTSPQASGLVSVQMPLNAPPLQTPDFEHGGAEPGKEQCFVVRTVESVASIAIESEPSQPVCVTPVDRFAPAAPTGLAVVATTGAMNLIWDANHEPDVAGYLVLRGPTPGDTLQPLTPEPIRETRFRDTTAQAGVRYVYVIVAVDRTGNRSAPSARVEETAR